MFIYVATLGSVRKHLFSLSQPKGQNFIMVMFTGRDKTEVKREYSLSPHL